MLVSAPFEDCAMSAVLLSRGILIARLRCKANRHFTLALDYSNEHNLCLRPPRASRYPVRRIAWRGQSCECDY